VSHLKVVQLDAGNIGDIPAALRALAESIEAGNFDDAHNLVWVIDCGAGRVEVGLMGRAGELGAVAHFLLSLGAVRLQDGALA